MLVSDDDGLDRILDHDTVAVVGCSTTPDKAAHDIPAYLQRHGYRIVPVNPFADEILDETAYDTLAEVPDSIDVDVVNVFRPSEEAGESSTVRSSGPSGWATCRRCGSSWTSPIPRRASGPSTPDWTSFKTSV